MRPTLALILLFVLLVLGGTLFVVLGRPATTLAVDAAPPAVVDAADTRKHDAALVTPVAAPKADGSGRAERSNIAVSNAPSQPAAKSTNLATLVGRVIDTAGQPIAGAEVSAFLGDFDFPDFDEPLGPKKDNDRLRANSDAQGAFAIAGVKPGSVRINVRAAGFVPLSKQGVGVPDAPRQELGDFTLETSVILEGHVVDSRGAGVEGARLTRATADGVMVFSSIDDSNQGPPALAVTAADGSFRIDQLASGPWRLRIASETHPDKLESGLTKRPGERVPGLSFALEDGFEIAGRVTGVPPAASSDASVVAMPPSAQGEMIFLGTDDGAQGENRRRAKLTSDGSFVVKGLRQGNYQLQARVKGSQDALWPRSASERVEAKSGDRGVLIAWQPASILSFQVVDAQSKAPIEDLQVNASLRGGMGFFDPSQRKPRHYENGLVQLDDLRPRDGNDHATLDVASAGYQNLHMTDIALSRGVQSDLGVLELKRTSTVDVKVIDSVTKAGIAKAKVTLSLVDEDSGGGGGFALQETISASSDNGDVSFSSSDSTSTRTDAAGLARINSTPGKRGKLSVSIEGYAPYSGEAFDMPVDANVEQTVVLDQGGSVEITLLSAAGTPVSGARIDHRAPSNGGDPFGDFGGPFGRGKGAATDAQGKMTMANLAPGTHRFRPAKGGGPDMEEGMVFAIGGGQSTDSSWSEVEIVRGTTVTLVLHEPERAEIKGRVREGGGVLAGASISLKKRGEEARFEGMDDMPFGGGGPKTKSDGEGRYRFEKVDAGSYELVVRHATRAMAARFPVEVTLSGLEYDIDLPISILEGRVRDAENKPVVGAKVWAERKPASGRTSESRVISIMGGGDDGGGMVFDSAASLDQSKAITDEQGHYSLRGVENDTDLIVRVDAKDCEPAKSEPVSVALGQTKTGVDVEASPAGQIKVKVKTAAGKNAGPCMVQAEYLDPTPEGKQVQPKNEFAQGGSATLRGLRPGRWKLSAQVLGNFNPGDPSSQGENREVVVVAHEVAQVELPLP